MRQAYVVNEQTVPPPPEGFDMVPGQLMTNEFADQLIATLSQVHDQCDNKVGFQQAFLYLLNALKAIDEGDEQAYELLQNAKSFLIALRLRAELR